MSLAATVIRWKPCVRFFSSNARPRIMARNTYYRYKRNNPEGIQPQKFQYFLVLDFEATCDRHQFLEMEVIEFPCLKVDSQQFEVTESFHRYVRPVKHPALTDFCTELTGITQGIVDDEDIFTVVLEDFLKWMESEGVKTSGETPNSIFVTCGDWDLQTMLKNQCHHSGIQVPDEMKAWINIKQAFCKSSGVYPRGIKDMMQRLGLQHEGRLHSGIDDCKNIVKILHAIAKRGFVFDKTSP